MEGKLFKTHTDETTGITTFIYSLTGTEEELSDYSLLKGKYYGVVDGKPVYSSPWYFGKEDCFGKHLKKGYYFPRQQVFIHTWAHTDQFGGNPYKILSDLDKDKNWLLYEKNIKLIEEGKRKKSNKTKEQVKDIFKAGTGILSSDELQKANEEAKTKTKEEARKDWLDSIGSDKLGVPNINDNNLCIESIEEQENEDSKNITHDNYNGSYAQDIEDYSDQDIDDIFDGDPDMYWNID